jgi:hypothetical protein
MRLHVHMHVLMLPLVRVCTVLYTSDRSSSYQFSIIASSLTLVRQIPPGVGYLQDRLHRLHGLLSHIPLHSPVSLSLYFSLLSLGVFLSLILSHMQL